MDTIITMAMVLAASVENYCRCLDEQEIAVAIIWGLWLISISTQRVVLQVQPIIAYAATRVFWTTILSITLLYSVS